MPTNHAVVRPEVGIEEGLRREEPARRAKLVFDARGATVGMHASNVVRL